MSNFKENQVRDIQFTIMDEDTILYKLYFACRIFQSICAMVLNLVILICVVRYKYLRSSANLLVGGIALTDFIHALATAVVLPLRFLPLQWAGRTAICLTGMTSEAVTIMLELVSFAVLAMERWNSLLAKLNRSRKWTTKQVFSVTLLLWTIISVWTIGVAIFKDIQPAVGMPCVVDVYFPKYFAYVSMGVFLISSATITYFYGHIACITCSSAQRVAAAAPPTMAQQLIRHDLNITRMMAKVVGVFFCLYGPFFFIAFTISKRSPAWHRVLFYVAVLIYDVNFWINPLIYAGTDKKFQKAFEDILPQRLTKLWKKSDVPVNIFPVNAITPGPSGTGHSEAVQLQVKPVNVMVNNTVGTNFLTFNSGTSGSANMTEPAE